MSYNELGQKDLERHPDELERGSDEPSEAYLLYRPLPRPWHAKIPTWVWALHMLLLSGNLCLFVTLFAAHGRENCHSREPFHSPELDAVGYHWQTWNLSLGSPSPYTAPPGPEVDALWEEITANPRSKVDGLLVPKEQFTADASAITYPNGDYVALVDVFHQLHCLNHLRKVVYKDAYPETQHVIEQGGLGDAHTAHCIDSLRLSLQCSADTSLITFNWIADYPMPWANFSSTHKCRNWDQLLDWARGQYDRKKDIARKTGGLRHPVIGSLTSDVPWKVPLKPEDLHYLDAEGNEIHM